MKVLVTLLLVCFVCVAVAQTDELPHGSDYIDGFLCPLPPPIDGSESDCTSTCNVDECDADTHRCCPTTPGCKDCIEAVATDENRCEIDGEAVSPLYTFVDDCEFCVCINGDIYCHELSEDDCTTIPEPLTAGVSCTYGDRNINPGELTLVQPEDEDCEICVCGNGILFCTSSDICGSNITCELDDGDEIDLGETVTIDDGCTVCTCVQSGEVECTPSDAFCPMALCEYNGEELEVGDTVPSEDGCNECTCTDTGIVACTERACFNPCNEPMVVGSCDALIPSWFYNSESGECEMFNYGGCEGNGNRFANQQDCQAECDEDACPEGQIPVTCDVNPCQSLECDAVEGAECSVDYCGGCQPIWYLGDEDVTDQCGMGCPDGVDLVACFEDPCENSECDEEGAVCVANYCGGCNALWFLEDREVCLQGQECPEDVDEVECFVAPCEFASCPAFPFARCVDDYCGGCNARFYLHNGEEVTEDCEGDCEDGEEPVFCFRRPCEDAICPAIPDATCVDDYCGGCNVRWILEDDDVTERCSDSSNPIEPLDYPTCLASGSDICTEECASHDDCLDAKLCCRGCGSSCLDAVNLPYYEVPRVCPPQVIALSDESATCDLECQSDTQCPGDNICCRVGCSSSCQVGMIAPEPCNMVRELLENEQEDDEEDDEDDEDATNNDGGTPLVGQYVPGCLEEGYFNPVQIWENNKWCVNVVTGAPISDAYTLSDGLPFSCPNCTHNGDVFYAGQTFYDGCNTCICSGTGVPACTRRACLDPCTLPVETGTCDDRISQYFFDTESRQCELFMYSGCGGNTNRFSTAADCLHACLPDSVCLFEWDEGEPCEDEDESVSDLYFYYDAERGQCNTTLAYNCEGNGNRFQNGFDCLDTCDPSNPGPTDAYGTPCWLIACDFPICGDGYEIAYSDDVCCPYCLPDDAEECDDDEFRCLDGSSCVPGDRVCDGLRDCDDGTDELGDECDPSIVPCEFRCSEEQCIPENFVCDGVLDCENALDESECDDDEFVSGAPFYLPPFVCPESTDLLGPCDVSECVTDVECVGVGLCCPNNCNQRICVRPVAASPACSAIVQALSANVRYIPQCLASGDYRPLQCSGEDDQQICWCVNVLSGIPFTTTHSSFYPDCDRCDYDGSSYAPGQRYTAEDGCNTCLCTAGGESICTRTACVEEDCSIGDDIVLEHGETRELDCLSCLCMYGQLNCNRDTECVVDPATLVSIRVEMRFEGEFPTNEDELEELERDAIISLLRLYGQSLDLDQDQIEIVEVIEGSVVIVIVFEDNEDQTGATVTVLVSQMEQDYMDGTLIIRLDDRALVPTGDDFEAEMVSRYDEEDDNGDILWWHGLIIGVAGSALIILVVVLAIVIFSCCRKGPKPSKKGEDTGNVEMKKVPL